MTPLISIIIPNYNNARYIDACLNSVSNQTYKNLEIIIIDDCSTDDSICVIKPHVISDKRIRLIQISKNMGVGNARNLGLDRARGEYIFFIDPDDILKHDIIEILLNMAIANSADLVLSNYTSVPENFVYKFDNDKSSAEYIYFDNNISFVESISNLTLVTVWGKLFKSDLIHKFRFRTDIFPYEDVEFMLRLYVNLGRAVITESTSIYYRESKTSVIKNKTRDVSNDVIAVIQSFYDNEKYYNDKYKSFIQKYSFMFVNMWIKLIKEQPKTIAVKLQIKKVGRTVHKTRKIIYASKRISFWAKLKTKRFFCFN